MLENTNQTGGSKTIEEYINELVKPQYKNTENYKKFIVASTKKFAEYWWKSTLLGIHNSGVKTRLGRTTIMAGIGHTGGDPKLYKDSLYKGRFYTHHSIINSEKGHDIAKLEPALAGDEKEKDWMTAYWDNFIKGTNKAKDFLDAINERQFRYN